MREFVSTLASDGRVTIPFEVRRLLGVKSGDKVAFRIEGGMISLAPVELTWNRSLTP